ncbi:MAG: AAA family ATPase [Armatimonadetes bacterium]|nr:AAA family ATPase [Armatimonadota bacterium]
MRPIVIVSGPPAAGKTTISRLVASGAERGVCVPVDDVREWVVAGRADPVPEWTDETARQFQLAEDAVADLARRYQAAGFLVVIDHCRLPENIEAWERRCFVGVPLMKVALVPPLETLLERNLQRTNKDFDPRVLEPVITGVHRAYAEATLDDWLGLENADQPDVAASLILRETKTKPDS